MINEIFAGHDPVIPLSLMTQAQKDNELERIFEGMYDRKMGNYNEPGGSGSTVGRFKRHIDHEFDRGFAAGFQQAATVYEGGWLAGYDKGYTAGRDQAEAR